ncbi:hypothetical protein ADIS_1608 [Lunatimonas lonarensis]|uniref:DUF2911 domain-containing protein n=2 Tax=Lunatimonas lonarensis TaxID=1232681 RepID=R7ZUR9_9BACT|nr:hypothetical protein ADIS_1608 [Lunatimonas lonarensis]
MRILRNRIFVVLAVFFVVSACGTDKTMSTDTSQGQASGELTLSQLEKEHVTELVAYADSVNRGLREDTERGSARLEISGTVGNTKVTVNHGSPGVRGRVIWNGLVSYDQVWVSGSHWATAVTFSDAVVVAGTEIPAGMYAFFTIPGREQWTLIINERFDQHLAEEYSESEDLVRINVDPILLDQTVQRLTYQVEARGPKQGVLAMSWEKIRVELPFETR